MRTIEISTAVFAKIWSHRLDGEETENAILERILDVRPIEGDASKSFKIKPMPRKKILWRDDVRQGLLDLGGEADLKDIYIAVRDIRRKAGRSIPINAHAIIRRELETNSQDSEAHTGKFNWFRPVNGIGGGRWAILDYEG